MPLSQMNVGKTRYKIRQFRDQPIPITSPQRRAIIKHGHGVWQLIRYFGRHPGCGGNLSASDVIHGSGWADSERSVRN
jgi:hypothetical protein